MSDGKKKKKSDTKMNECQKRNKQNDGRIMGRKYEELLRIKVEV